MGNLDVTDGYLRVNARERDPYGAGRDLMEDLSIPLDLYLLGARASRVPAHGKELLYSPDGDCYVVDEGARLEWTIDADLLERRLDGTTVPAARWRP